MAKKPRKPKQREAPADGGAAPDQPPPEDQKEHREAVIEKAESRDLNQRKRPEEMRMDMMRSIITEPLLSQIQQAQERKETGATFDVIIAINEFFEGGVPNALQEIRTRAEKWGVTYATVSNYCFATLTADQVLKLADEARALFAKYGRSGSVIYRIWEDTDIDVTLTKSLATIKADAAQRSFRAFGREIVWAVLDSGVQGDHPHFAAKATPFGPMNTLATDAPLAHTDFTPDGSRSENAGQNMALVDRFGHGSHVAGIIAGYWQSPSGTEEPVVGTEMRNEATNEPIRQRDGLSAISGVAPLCKVLSLKVIADVTLPGASKQTAGQGKVSWVLKAIEQIQEWNQHGKRLLIQGANLSLGYEFDPRWFACGQSPVCVEVNRLVKSGVSVVVSAGNSGYSTFVLANGRSEARFNDLSVTDPGNAELAVTVGSTHRDMPHTYGVSYFSSRGPTGDGRTKPDLLAPGERIISCAAGLEAAKYGTAPNGQGEPIPALYCEQTGTSMAAPHVSGAIAAFLSVRHEFVGQPERVKEIFMANCVDLKRERSFQGAGLLDLMKALQAV
ncbi:Major intracellular serine protease precursor [Luteitalea pratensis]|uniref:Major intracellular serine protease n=1 Tax=Luteitalea pratensis TaxID=1855912 RepID=A0A143PLC2_LUTPR|nr:S8 family peptidase [Luteitalea pratensis]AMY09206.1 Major intracellular serine protease precursor [Luteitalea pratensis]